MDKVDRATIKRGKQGSFLVRGPYIILGLLVIGISIVVLWESYFGPLVYGALNAHCPFDFYATIFTVGLLIYYYRIQSPAILIELDHVPPRPYAAGEVNFPTCTLPRTIMYTPFRHGENFHLKKCMYHEITTDISGSFINCPCRYLFC